MTAYQCCNKCKGPVRSGALCPRCLCDLARRESPRKAAALLTAASAALTAETPAPHTALLVTAAVQALRHAWKLAPRNRR